MELTAAARVTPGRPLRIAAVVLLAASAAPVLGAQHVVETAGGRVRGTVDGDVQVFKGIPFASPPVGELRFREPQPAAPWTTIRDADEFSPACPQRGMYPPDAPAEATSEDCLYLNVWTPLAAGGAKLPVMLWLHGGGLRNGSASTPLYAGDQLARRGVMVVTANYRLGVLGFLAHPDLTKESRHRSSGNYGLMDQIAALTWIQQNIAAFGGDPDRVTVFGQSSGAMAISALISSPRARGLFHRAIGQSGGLFEPMELASDLKLKGAEAAGQRFLTRAKVASLAELRATPVSALLDVPFRANIIVDGHILARPPYGVHQRGEHSRVPVLVGYTADEGQAFLRNRTITTANYTTELKRDFPGILVRLTAPDPGMTDAQARGAALAFERDVRFGWSMWAWARLASRAGDAGVYLYQFTQPTPYPAGSPQAGEGAAHGSDMIYAFGHLAQQPWSWTEHDRRLSATMLAYWTNFAKSGDPNGPGVPAWPRFAPATPMAMQLGGVVAPAAFGTGGTLRKLDRTYGTARRLWKNRYVIPAVAGVGSVWILR